MIRTFSGKFFNALVLALALMIAVPWAAFADGLVADADSMVTDASKSGNSVSFSQQAGTSVEYDFSAMIKDTGNSKDNVFAQAGDTVTVTINRGGDWLDSTDGGSPASFSFSTYASGHAGKIKVTVPCNAAANTSKTITAGLTALASNGRLLSPDSVTLSYSITATTPAASSCSIGGGDTGGTTPPADTTAPVITVPADMILEATSASGAVPMYTPTADGSETVTCDPTSGSTFAIGAPHTVNCSATDAAGNTGTASFTVTARDTTAPRVSISLSPASADGSNGWYTSNVTVTISATDLVGVTRTEYSLDGGLTWQAYTGPFAVSANGSHTVDAGAVDAAANPGTDQESFKLDKTAPVITPSIIGTEGSDGWYTDNVTVTFAVADATSDVASKSATCDATNQVTSDTNSTGVSFTCTATNGAGLPASAAVTIKRDGSKPVISRTVTGTLGNNGWYTSDVGVSFDHSDPHSGIVSTSGDCAGPNNVTADTGSAGVSFSCTATNGAGLSETNSITIKRDASAPSITPAVTGALGNNGWYTSNVNVSFTVGDPQSGVVSSRGCDAVTRSTDTDGITYTCEATNGAGLTSSGSVTIKRDATAPTVTATPSRATPDHNGWYNAPLGITFEGNANDLSGIASCDSPVTYNTDSNAATVSGSCTDNAGNVGNGSFGPVKYDNTNPTLVPSVSPNPVQLNGAATASANANDNLSGVDSANTNCDAVDTSSVGTGKTVQCRTADNAGNTATASASYQVIYAWAGFLQPINDTAHQVDTSTSIFKAGSTVPAKFVLKDANGNVVQAVAAPLWITPAKGSALSAAVNESLYGEVATGGTTYTWTGTHYQYNWGTAKSQGGYYWRIGVKLDDGTTRYVNLGLRS